MIRLALGMVAGAAGVLQLPALPPAWLWLVWLFFLLLALCCRRSLVVLLIGLLAGAAGAGWHAAERIERQLDAQLIGATVTLRGIIEGVPDHAENRSVFRLRVQAIEGAEPVRVAAQRLRVSWYRPAGHLPAAGESWRFTLKLREAVSPGNPGSFDYRRWLFQQRVDALATVRSHPAPVRLQQAAGWNLHGWRARLAGQIAALPSADAQLGLMQALALGIGHGVSDTQRSVLQATGTAHLLAISGLHVGLVAGWAYAIAGLLWRWCCRGQGRMARRPFALVVASLAALVYALCAGLALPAQRALIMLATLALAGALQRSPAPLRVFAVAVVAVMLVDPLAPLSVGFWLSFGTVGALLYLHQGRLQSASRLRLLTGVHMQLGLVLLPITAWFFSSGALIAPLANLVAVPVVGLLVVPLALSTLALAGWLPGLADLALALGQWLLEQVLTGLQIALDASAGSVPLHLPGVECFLAALAGVLVLLAPRGVGLRVYAWPLMLPALWFNLDERAIEGVEVHMLDVGQGLAVLVLTRQHTLLYDTGDYRAPGVSQVHSVILPFLRQQGRQRIDTIVISHPDRDHAAGADDLHAAFPDARWFASQPGLLTAPQAEHCRAGSGWQHDDTDFAFLHPAEHDTGSDNDLSCVLLVHHGASRILLTGDIEAAGEAAMLRREATLPVTLMTAAHHGSRTSSSEPLLDALAPAYVVFPAGRGNRHGFPHPEVRLRYTLRGAEAFVTGIDGALAFQFDRSGLRQPPTAWWRSQRRIWHRSGE